MTHDEFTALVNRLEQQARQNPTGYQMRTLLLAMLGNTYLALILLLLLALLIGMLASIMVLKAIGAKLALVLGIFLWGVVKALWIKVAPPEGREITAREAPALFEMIGGLQRELGAPQFHHVLMTDDFNAAVVQAPRLGIFGWHDNYLLLGLPLMKALSEEQFKAVLAHEFGHLAGGHARTGNWIYRQRYRWSRLMDQLEADGNGGGFLFRPFLKWYAPYLNAYSFPLARANEYEADAAAARLTSPRAIAEALTGVNVIGSYLQQNFWPGVHKQADNLPRPGFMPFAAMGARLQGDIAADAADGWLRQALERKSNIDDTHPSLSDRLQAIGAGAQLAPPPAGSAADRLLGPALESITSGFDQQWLQRILPHWEQRHQEVQDGRRCLAELAQRLAAGDSLTIDEQYEHALLTESIGDDANAALAQLRQLQQQAPQDNRIAFSLGFRLLNRDDAAGVELLRQVMVADFELRPRCCELLRDYFWRTGDEQTAHEWHDRLLEAAQQQHEAGQERDRILLTDKFEPNDLAPDVLARLKQQLSAIDDIRKVYLVHKQVMYRPEHPCYVLGFTLRGILPWRRKQRAQQVIAALQQQVEFPAETLLISVEGDNYRFGRKFRWMRGSRIL